MKTPIRIDDTVKPFQREAAEPRPPRLPVRLDLACYLSLHNVRLYVFGDIGFEAALADFLASGGIYYQWVGDDSLRGWKQHGDAYKVIVGHGTRGCWVATLDCEPLLPMSIDLAPSLALLLKAAKFVAYEDEDNRPTRPSGRASISRSVGNWHMSIYLDDKYDPMTVTDGEILSAMSDPELAVYTVYQHDHDATLVVVEVKIVTKEGNTIYVTGSRPKPPVSEGASP